MIVIMMIGFPILKKKIAIIIITMQTKKDISNTKTPATTTFLPAFIIVLPAFIMKYADTKSSAISKMASIPKQI